MKLENLDSLTNELMNAYSKTSPEVFPFDKEKLSSMIDHTILKAEATRIEVEKICSEAKEFSFATVCVNPSFVPLCKTLLKNSPVKVCTVIGFPLGATITDVKKFEAEQTMQNGAEEIDMVINIGRLKQNEYQYVFEEINQIVLVAKKNNGICKVIIETALLSDEEKVKACLIAKSAGADFVKTSTGFSKGGATASDISLMRFIVGKEIGVKASGGIRTYEDAVKMIESGANRIGASASVQIVNGSKSNAVGY
ncbi:MAG: deoxyribose-phosphate aldolase [Ignavibacteriales bacterium]|nr:deoxyribose-phosphate aldolase [Ignavibacteriales bacterium]